MILQKFKNKNEIAVASMHGKRSMKDILDITKLTEEEVYNIVDSLSLDREDLTKDTRILKVYLEINPSFTVKELGDVAKEHSYKTIYKAIKELEDSFLKKKEVEEIKEDFEIEQYVSYNRKEKQMTIPEVSHELIAQTIRENQDKGAIYVAELLGIKPYIVQNVKKKYKLSFNEWSSDRSEALLEVIRSKPDIEFTEAFKSRSWYAPQSVFSKYFWDIKKKVLSENTASVETKKFTIVEKSPVMEKIHIQSEIEKKTVYEISLGNKIRTYETLGEAKAFSEGYYALLSLVTSEKAPSFTILEKTITTSVKVVEL